jgi:hypothetical protein
VVLPDLEDFLASGGVLEVSDEFLTASGTGSGRANRDACGMGDVEGIGRGGNGIGCHDVLGALDGYGEGGRGKAETMGALIEPIGYDFVGYDYLAGSTEFTPASEDEVGRVCLDGNTEVDDTGADVEGVGIGLKD